MLLFYSQSVQLDERWRSTTHTMMASLHPHTPRASPPPSPRPFPLAPDSEGAVGGGGDEVPVGGVEDDGLHGVLVAAQLGEERAGLGALLVLRLRAHRGLVLGGLAAEHAEELDVAVVRGGGDARAAAVEGELVERVLAALERGDLHHHAHVPELHDAVGVAGADHVAAVRDGDVVAGVEVAVEGLHAEARARVPQAHRLVAGAGADVIAERLPGHGVDAVHVAAEGLAAAHDRRVPEPRGVVHGAGRKEVAGAVVGHVPHGLRVVRERRAAARRGEVPDLHRIVPGARGEAAAIGAEVGAAEPVHVPLAAHDELAVGHGPDLPGHVVRRGAEDGLLRVERE
mmetsp:Transcript_18281/g.55849  ORF Transcript_18281/g.55849 Transcript_18281/m.55849 type:complete len:342 (-) Transcript_18281:1246-2271(-)